MFPPSSTGCSTANEDHCLSRPSWGPGVASRHSRGTGRGSRLCRRAGRESICSRGTMNGRSRGAGNGSRRYRGAGSWRMCSRGAGSRSRLEFTILFFTMPRFWAWFYMHAYILHIEYILNANYKYVSNYVCTCLKSILLNIILCGGKMVMISNVVMHHKVVGPLPLFRTTTSQVRWPSLKTTWGLFEDRPITRSAAIKAGWTFMDSCNGQWLGER